MESLFKSLSRYSFTPAFSHSTVSFIISDRDCDQELTSAIHSTRYSSIKLLKYWSRNSNPGPKKTKSWRCISLLVMWATCRQTQREALTTQSQHSQQLNVFSGLFLIILQYLINSAYLLCRGQSSGKVLQCCAMGKLVYALENRSQLRPCLYPGSGSYGLGRAYADQPAHEAKRKSVSQQSARSQCYKRQQLSGLTTNLFVILAETKPNAKI